MAEPKFSIPEHTRYLAGYLDAVGRELTSEEELVSLSSNYLSSMQTAEDFLCAPILDQHLISDWGSEFGSLIEDKFGINERSRLGFYLIEYIVWFQQFTDNAVCLKVECQSRPEILFEAIYLLKWCSGEKVVLSFTHSKKVQSE